MPPHLSSAHEEIQNLPDIREPLIRRAHHSRTTRFDGGYFFSAASCFSSFLIFGAIT
jgi:hypothetical protein